MQKRHVFNFAADLGEKVLARPGLTFLSIVVLAVVLAVAAKLLS